MSDTISSVISNPAITGGVGIAGDFLGSVGTALSKGRLYETEATIKGQNAKMLRDAAEDAKARGMVTADEIGRKTARTIGEQNAALAANGIIVGRDSALDLVTETAGIGAMDAITAINNAQNEANNDILKAQIAELEAKSKRQEAASTRGGGLLSAGSTALRQSKELYDRINALKVPAGGTK